MGSLNVIDIIILLIILVGGLVGFRDGFLKRLVSVIGMILVIVLAFILKNYVSVIFYENLPFLYMGIFRTAPVLNIVFYELVAFLLVAAVLGVFYYILLTITGLVEKILKATIILSIPSKILGFVVGLIENYLWVCLILFLLTLPIFRLKGVEDSKIANFMMNNTPFISNYTSKISVLYDDIYKVLNDKTERSTEETNVEILDLMLKYDFISVESVDKLLEKDKILVNNHTFINKYRVEEDLWK